MQFLIFYYIPITFPSHSNRSFTTFLVGFLLKELYVFQEHLTAVILEKTQSPYHIMFTKAKKTWRERSAVILQGFGPIEDDDNVSYTFISSYFGTSLAPPCNQSALSNRWMCLRAIAPVCGHLWNFKEIEWERWMLFKGTIKLNRHF